MRKMGFAVWGAMVMAGAARGGGELNARRVAFELNRPTDFVAAPGDATRMFIVEQPGIIKVLDLVSGQVLPTAFLNIDGNVSNEFTANSERGLFSLAFHPQYFVDGDPNEGYFFVHYSDNSGSTTIERYRVSQADPNVADPTSALLIFSTFQPFANHNGGTIVFGPRDGYLYIALGDGGSFNDPGNRAQNDFQFLGKILRIDVNHSAPGDPYDLPPSNPFVASDPLDEIWAKGVRNPWRITFDRMTGDLYIADVGQNAVEEIDFQPASSLGGENYGWRCMEGTSCTGLTGCTCNAPALKLPIRQYTHADGLSVTGGYVYRGCGLPSIQGHYFYADFSSGRVWSFKAVNGMATEFQERTADLNPPDAGGAVNQVSSFGQDAAGEMYIVDRGSGNSSTGGQIFKIVAEAPQMPPAGDAPVVVHTGLNGTIFGGYIDPRAESNNGTDLNQGLRQMTLQFSKPVVNRDCTLLDSRSFSVAVTDGAAPTVASVDASQNPRVVVRLNGLPPLQEWTTLVADVQDFEGRAIVSAGNQGPGVDEADRIDFGFLPCDVNNDGSVSPIDLLRFRQIVGMQFTPPEGTREDFADTDRNGAIQPLDLLRFRQLILGTGIATRNWSVDPHNMMLSPRP